MVETPILVENGVGILMSTIFITMGYKFIKNQEERIRAVMNAKDNQSDNVEVGRNPLPAFKIWIGINCAGQVTSLLETIIFAANGC